MRVRDPIHWPVHAERRRTRSPNGHLLLTKLTKGVKIWTEARTLGFHATGCSFSVRIEQDGVCRKTISRGSNVNSITWLPGGDGELLCQCKLLACKQSLTDFIAGFLAVEGSYVTKLVRMTSSRLYHFDPADNQYTADRISTAIFWRSITSLGCSSTMSL